MKQFLYVLTFVASVGTVGAVATNPQLVQQGASFLGMASPDTAETSVESEDDHLAKFLSQYPYAGKNDPAGPKEQMPAAPAPTPQPSIASKTPELPKETLQPAPTKEPAAKPVVSTALPKSVAVEVDKSMVEKPALAAPKENLPKEPLKKPEPKEIAAKVVPKPVATPKAEEPKKAESAKLTETTKPTEPKMELPEVVLVAAVTPKIEQPKIEQPKIEPPKIEPPKEVAAKKEPEKSEKTSESSLAPLPALVPIVVNTPAKESRPEPVTVPPIAQKPATETPKVADPFSTAEVLSIQSPAPQDDTIGMASTRKPEPEAGFASTRSHSVYESGNLSPSAPAPPPSPAPMAAAPPVTPPASPLAEALAAASPAQPSPTPQAAPVDPFLASLADPNAQTSVNTSPWDSTYLQENQTPSQVPTSFAAPAMPNRPSEMPQQPYGTPPPMAPPNVQALMQDPPAQQQAAQPKAASQFQVNPSIVAEEIPCHGSEIVARVGREVIMMCDILPQLRRAAMRVVNEQMKKMPPEERAQVPRAEIDHFVDQIVQSQYPMFLQEQIRDALVYNDFFVAKNKEERETFEKKFGEEFDLKEIPEMIKEFGLRDIVELKKFLKEELGSSIDKERRIWMRSLIAQQWIHFCTQGATSECTHDEMMEFYTANKDAFTSQARVRWQEMFVALSNHKTEQDAYMKIAWMGNQVAAGFSLEDIAKKNSDGFTASKGGLWDWTFRGTLSSEELENAIFTQPVGVMSPKIIKSEKGFHLVRVVEKEEARTLPFIDAQVRIRERIRNQRRQKIEQEYFEDLNRRYPTIVLKEKIDFDLERRAANEHENHY